MEQFRTIHVPTVISPGIMAASILQVPTAMSLEIQGVSVEFCTPLQEIKVLVSGKVVVAGVLDEGSEIVVVRKDLWEELGFKVNRARLMLMQLANGVKEVMEGCANESTMQVLHWVNIYSPQHFILTQHNMFWPTKKSQIRYDQLRQQCTIMQNCRGDFQKIH